MENKFCQIIAGSNETSIDLKELSNEEVTHLHIASMKKFTLEILKKFPNLIHLSLCGKFIDLKPISQLKFINSLELRLSSPLDLSYICNLNLKSLTINCLIDEVFISSLSENLEYLHLSNIRQIKDLTFIEQAVNLKKIYLESLPNIICLPDFSKIPFLYALKIYELHKLNNIDGLINSKIKFMDLALTADKLSGTKISEVLLQMKELEQLNIYNLDRGSLRRYNVIENKMKNYYKNKILNDEMSYDSWIKL